MTFAQRFRVFHAILHDSTSSFSFWQNSIFCFYASPGILCNGYNSSNSSWRLIIIGFEGLPNQGFSNFEIWSKLVFSFSKHCIPFIKTFILDKTENISIEIHNSHSNWVDKFVFIIHSCYLLLLPLFRHVHHFKIAFA